MHDLLFKGLFLGFAIASPVGPIGLLCINRTIQKGKFSGFLSGMGAATADMFYGAIAAFGLSAVSDFLIKESSLIKTLGSVFLLYLGIKIFLAKKNTTIATAQSKNLAEDYFSTFFLTLSNPLTILSFTAVFAGMGIIELNKNFSGSILLLIGVFSGSALWWLLLSHSVDFVSQKTNTGFTTFINKISGVIIILFGLFYLLHN